MPNFANLDYVARVNRAVDYVTQLLSHRPGARLTEIALSCGFASSADFELRAQLPLIDESVPLP